MADDTAKLRGLLQSLPQELYDEIYNLTFTASSDTRTYVDEDWKPSHLLHVDRLSRYKYAASFFETIFVFHRAGVVEAADEYNVKWLIAQDPANLKYVPSIEFTHRIRPCEMPPGRLLDWIRGLHSIQIKEILEDRYEVEAALTLAERLTLVYEDEATGRILATAYAE